MSADFLLKVATVLEEAAKVIDEHTAEKQAAVARTREESLKSLSSKYAEATGEELPAEIFSKLSSSNEDVLATVNKIVEKTAGSTGVDSLGRSSEKVAQRQPVTKKEAADAAWERFGSFINS